MPGWREGHDRAGRRASAAATDDRQSERPLRVPSRAMYDTGGFVKLLLTSAGIRNPSIHDALVEMLGKPIAECSALCISTASYGHPMAGPVRAWHFISGQEPETPMCELGWKSLGALDLGVLPSLDDALWVPMLRETDALLVNGGDTLFLRYWMRQSGLADLLPSLRAVWVGLSAGSLVMAPRVAEEFV